MGLFRTWPAVLIFTLLLGTLLPGWSAHARSGSKSLSYSDQAYLLANAREDINARIDLITHSQSPFLSVFEMAEDKIGLVQMAALIKSAQAGGHPRLLLDALGHQISRNMLRYLEEQNIEVRLFRTIHTAPVLENGAKEALQRMHDKILTNGTDLVITGGRNSREPYFGLDPQGKNFIDFDVLVKGKTGQDARIYQEELWTSPMVQRPARHTLTDADRDALVAELNEAVEDLQNANWLDINPVDWLALLRPVGSEFIHDQVTTAGTTEGSEKALFELIEQARSEILIDAQYLILTPDMEAEFTKAVKRGVHIEIVTNGEQAFRVGSDRWTQEAFELSKPRLRALGISVREFEGPGKIHSKEVVADRSNCLIWSFNLDPRSRHINYESGAHIESPLICGQLADALQTHMDVSTLTIDNGKQLVPDRNISFRDRALIDAIHREL